MTLDELRAKWPAWEITPPLRVPRSPTLTVFKVAAFPLGGGPWIVEEGRTDTEAIVRLAAKLEEITPVETEQQFRECPACNGRGGYARQVSDDEWYHSSCEVCEGRREVPVEELT